jgi:hypothetical protein
MHEQDLQDIVDTLCGMTERFQEPTTAAAPHLSSVDRAAFKRLMLEAKSMLTEDLGPLNDFNLPLLKMANLPGYGAFNPPDIEQLQEAIGLVEGGLNVFSRKQSHHPQPTGHAAPKKAPYVEPDRIAELKALKNPTWDPRRLIRMLEELNLAHAHGMDMATAMLVRAVTDHVPPIFGKSRFADVASQYSAGSVDGRSFKGAMSNLADSMKHIADGILHVHIRHRETLPTSTQVNFSQSLDVLLGEIVRVLRS